MGGDNAGNTGHVYAQMGAKIQTATHGSEDGIFVIETLIGNSAIERMQMNETETVFNEGGTDLDFRVESDSNTHALAVDAGAEVVSVGTSTTAGTTSNFMPMVAGTFSTQSGTTDGGTSGGTVTLMTFGSNQGNFLVSALGSGTGATADNTTGIIHLNNAASTYTALVAGSRVVLSMDGLALKCTQSIFNNANINWNVIRISR
tara:strand:- start:369 stop:977 length:609 start_codon:yes stop_codon:yes gene_type:complete